jgi:hypothetical protein
MTPEPRTDGHRPEEPVRDRQRCEIPLLGGTADRVRPAAAQGHAGVSEYVDSRGVRRAERIYQWYLDDEELLQATLR